MSQTLVAVTATPDGGAVVTGQTSGPIDAGGGMLPFVGQKDVLIVSMDATGAHRWSRTFGSVVDDEGFDITSDQDGNVYVSGHVDGSVDFGGGMVRAPGGVDMFVASYAPDGTFRWGRIWGSPIDGDVLFGLAADTDLVYATGWYKGTIDFGDGPRTPANGQDVVMLVLDHDGNTSFSRSFGGLLVDQGQKIAVGADGSLAIAGLFTGTIDLGGGEVTAAGDDDAFIVRLAADGTPRWSNTFGATLTDRGIGVAIGRDLEAYACGEFAGTVDLGLGPATAEAADGFLIRHDDSPTPTWVRTLTGASDGMFVQCTAMPDGRVMVAGRFGIGGASLAGTPIPNVGLQDAFTAAFDPDGTVAWIRPIGGPGIENIHDTAVSPGGVIYATGSYTDVVDFGDGPKTPMATDGFLLRYEPEP